MEIERNLEISKRKNQHSYIRYFAPAIDIYDQVQLLKSNCSQSQLLPFKNNKQIAVIFDLEGELSGKAICVMDVPPLSNQNNVLTRSLFIESMNILLGQFLTNLEIETGIMAVITSPKLITEQELLPDFNDHSRKSKINFSLNYHLISDGNENFTIISILGNKLIDISEV